MSTRAGLGTIVGSSDIARFVQGGVVKTFRCTTQIKLNSNRPDAQTRFKTDTATLTVFDPACVQHRAEDDADWWSIPDDECAEINAGNVAFVSLGVDGTYDCDVFRDSDRCQIPPGALTINIRTVLGCFYVGAGEYVVADGIGPDTRYGGVLMSLPAGNWTLAVTSPAAGHLVLRLAPLDTEAANSFDDSPRLS
ncbi:hypothetical protein RISK_004496 [Rhodopirellula islandica]|uniref:Uncharacterized protein n=1 Tax=Rhodopirellula islandica TaxID=595434 RepID=A0A0J1B9U4_RHOIS|nr:hypothetical protein RISK_004496 [Rhodopirellula islandica]